MTGDVVEPGPDEDLAAVWLDWWENGPVSTLPTIAEAAAQDLATFSGHLAAHGFAIVRRMADPEPPDDEGLAPGGWAKSPT